MVCQLLILNRLNRLKQTKTCIKWDRLALDKIDKIKPETMVISKTFMLINPNKEVY